MTRNRDSLVRRLERRWICLGVTDEWHPFCLFATRDEAKVKEHEMLPGHWCDEVSGTNPREEVER